jgi:hypothetical protein
MPSNEGGRGAWPGDGKMSNIANQLIAVAATLLGFVAHDALTQRDAPTTVAAFTQTSVDPIVTRAINLEGLSADWLSETRRAEREGQLRPLLRISGAAAAPRVDPRQVASEFADVHISKARVAAPGGRNDAFIR